MGFQQDQQQKPGRDYPAGIRCFERALSQWQRSMLTVIDNPLTSELGRRFSDGASGPGDGNATRNRPPWPNTAFAQ
jgi:hypothetical protein